MIKYKSGFKYQLDETYSCVVNIHPDKDILTDYLILTKRGTLTIKKGYAWDGPSGPTIDTKSFMRGALVHDALYQLLRMGLLAPRYRKEADEELYRICLEDGMWKFRANYVFKAVRKAAGFAASPENKKEIKTAP
jgi:hypothetical protein